MSEENEQSSIDPLTIGELINLKEASEKTGFSISYLRDIAQTGRLKAKKIGRDWLTTMAAVEEYKRTRKYIVKEDEKTS